MWQYFAEAVNQVERPSLGTLGNSCAKKIVQRDVGVEQIDIGESDAGAFKYPLIGGILEGIPLKHCNAI